LFTFIGMKKCRIIIAGLLTIHSHPNASIAQGLPHFVERLTINEGLSSNIITDLAQDDNGFLWIATPDGLNRFDGTETVHFLHDRDSNSLPHSYINCLLKLPGNELAVGTSAGISFLNTTTGFFSNFYSHHLPSLDLYNNTIAQLALDARGNCWAASRACIYIFNPKHCLKKIIPSPFTESNASRERLSFVEKMLPLSNGDVLLYLNSGWALYSAASDSLFRYQRPPAWLPVGNPSIFPPGRLFKIFSRNLVSIPPGKDSLLILDEQGRRLSSCFFPYDKYPYVSWSQQLVAIDSSHLLLLLHNYGLLIISLNWKAGAPHLSTLSPLLFDENEYQTALCDRQGNWWLATTKEGLQKISPSRQYFVGSPLIDHQSQRPTRYEVMSCSRFGHTLWVCTYGNGFFGIDLVTGRQTQHRLTGTGDDTWSNFIWNTSQQNKDTLFLGTQIGLFWYRTGTGTSGRLAGYKGKPPILDSVAITTQFLDSHGLLWMGLGKGKGLCTYDQQAHRFTWYPGNTADGYPLRYPTDIVEDAHADLWFTNDASTLLVHWDRQTNHFTKVGLPANPKRAGPLRGICCQADTVLWLGDVTGGLLRFNPRSNTVSYYDHDHGINNCHISDIRKDGQQRLWMVTEGGLVCFDPHTETFSNYTAKDGLPVTYPTGNSFYDPGMKRMYAGGHGAWFYFDPGNIRPSPSAKTTLITSLQVNGKTCPLDGNKPIVLHSQENDISIQYAAVDLIDGPSTRYLYRLIGADTGWISAGKQRQIIFSHLPAGHYTFQVRAAGNPAAKNDPTDTIPSPNDPATTLPNPNDPPTPALATISFRIEPAFAQTATFYALLATIFAAGILALYIYRKRQLSRTRQIRSEISRNLHDEVGANLTNISLSSLLAQRQLKNENAVSTILERIYQDSQLVSESMREIVWSINPEIDTLGEALPRMLHYASNLLETNKIELRAEIAPEVERLHLSMRQRRDFYLIFKEALNNMVRHSKASRALVQFYLSGRSLCMKIADNGTGFDLNIAISGNGLKNMRERARQHRWKLEVRSRLQQGTTITLDTG
jgi:signal transduction histidine kinase/ligand-binding sensor domain-containing protein